MPKKEKGSVFTAELELTRISKYNLRYRIINHDGYKCPLDHVEFDRGGFPSDDDFNMDFLLKDLGKDASKGIWRKQAKFRDYLNYKMVIG